MQFTPENARLVMAGDKTQTRRICKDGEDWASVSGRVTGVNGRLKWEVGREYSVCPGRGKKAIGRIRITQIRCEMVQDITAEDCQAEGISLPYHPNDYGLPFRVEFQVLWESLYAGQVGKQWKDNPLVWVLTFEVVNG